MIRVEMREDDVLDARVGHRPAELRGHLVRTVELEPGEAEKGCQRGKAGSAAAAACPVSNRQRPAG